MSSICNKCIHNKERSRFYTALEESNIYKHACWGCKYVFDSDYYEEALKPCPFCGSVANFRTDDGGDSGVETYSVECSNDNCACDIGWHKTKEQAARAWNRRI